ncbi:MAG: DUF2141 domain-containing protein [Pseudomonadota bacterium]
MRIVRLLLGIGALLAGASVAHADNAPSGNPFHKYSDPNGVVAAVQTSFHAEAGKSVRLAVYDSEANFLEMASIKHQGTLDESGLALVRFLGMEPGDYAFAAYLDENDDGRLNRGPLGIPKEPIAFSNGVVPKLRRPEFSETKVDVAPGSVVVITLED